MQHRERLPIIIRLSFNPSLTLVRSPASLVFPRERNRIVTSARRARIILVSRNSAEIYRTRRNARVNELGSNARRYCVRCSNMTRTSRTSSEWGVQRNDRRKFPCASPPAVIRQPLYTYTFILCIYENLLLFIKKTFARTKIIDFCSSVFTSCRRRRRRRRLAFLFRRVGDA